jgi:hypothetical protein
MKSAIIDEAIAKEIDDAIAKVGQYSSQHFIRYHALKMYLPIFPQTID